MHIIHALPSPHQRFSLVGQCWQECDRSGQTLYLLCCTIRFPLWEVEQPWSQIIGTSWPGFILSSGLVKWNSKKPRLREINLHCPKSFQIVCSFDERSRDVKGLSPSLITIPCKFPHLDYKSCVSLMQTESPLMQSFSNSMRDRSSKFTRAYVKEHVRWSPCFVGGIMFMERNFHQHIGGGTIMMCEKP